MPQAKFLQFEHFSPNKEPAAFSSAFSSGRTKFFHKMKFYDWKQKIDKTEGGARAYIYVDYMICLL